MTGVLRVLGLAVLGMGLVLTARAENVPGLYEAEIPVETQTSKERIEAIKLALQEVLVRVSGRHMVLTVTGIEEALVTPTRFVQQFRYRKVRAQKRHNKPTRVLWVRFDKGAINNLLHDNRMPVWGRTRPATLVWLVVDNRKTRVMLNTNSVHPVRDALEEQAKKRGLPLRLPLFDLADRSVLGVSDVWGNFEESIMRASERYQSEAVMVGRVFKTYSGGWQARWSLYSEGRQQDWESSAASIKETVLPGIDQTADTLGARFAQVQEEGSSDRLLVEISDVRGLAAYNKSLKYLKSLTLVTDVQPYKIEADKVIFNVSSRSGRLAVSQAISLGHTLVAAPAPVDSKPDSNTQITDLQYRLIP